MSSNFAPYIPLFNIAAKLIKEIICLHDKTQYNKNTCARLVIRVINARSEIKILKRTKKLNENKFKNQNFYNAFQRFNNTLSNIEAFEEELSKIGNFKKMVEANLTKEKFISLTDEFDTAMRDLGFSIMINNEEQRKKDFRSLEEDHEEMIKLLNYTKITVIDKIEEIRQEVQVIVSDYTSRTDKPAFKANKIESDQLRHCRALNKSDNRIKKKYKFFEVECRPIRYSEIRDRFYFAILGKLGVSPYILKFHGLSKTEGNDVEVLEWAELGSLRNFYNQHDIGWVTKVAIARDVCRGIAFLDSVNVYHEYICCENIMLTEHYEPKITIDKPREICYGMALPMPDLKPLRWMAPEKMNGSCYNVRCEIFSFGMMLWELSFEKFPYRNMDYDEIKHHVKSGHREKISFGRVRDEKEKDIQYELAYIIKSAWNHYPDQRINLGALLVRIEELYEKHVKPGVLPQIYSHKELDLDESTAAEECIEEDFDDLTIDYIKTIMPLVEGLEIHHQIKKDESDEANNEKRKIAWECFVDNANLGDYTAKFWKGYYLWKGYYVEKNSEEAIKLFKEAADNGVSGAQLRYAFSLITGKKKVSQDKIQNFIKYLTMAADNGNHTALYNLGDLYLNGKFKVPKNQDLGISKLRLAASYGNDAAKKLISQLGQNTEQ